MKKILLFGFLFTSTLFLYSPSVNALALPPPASPSPTPSGSSSGSTSPTLWCNFAKTEINTAIGCIPFATKEEFLSFLLKWALGIGGGIAFLLIVFAGFTIMTAQGNPERLQAGKELMTSAISGLVLLILAVVILRIIGVDILGIPGFGTK